MKTFYSFVAVLGVLTLAACQLPQGNTGALKITLPSSGVSRSLSGAVTGKGETVRLQLVRRGVVVPLDGADVLEKSASGQTITLEGLPTGAGYSLRVATGTRTSDDSFFQTVYFKQSDEFEISAGIETPVTVNLAKTPITLVASGSGPNTSVAKTDPDTNIGTLYFTSDAGLHSVSQWPVSADTAPLMNATALAAKVGPGRTIQSLGASSMGLFFNTNNGLVDWTPPNYDQSSFDTLDSVDVQQSGSFAFVNKGTTYKLDVYFGTGLIAGLRLGTAAEVAAGTAEWKSLKSMLDVDSLDANTKASLEKSDGLILGFGVANGRFAYIATALGTYRVSANMFDDSVDSQKLADKFTGGDDSVKIKASLNGTNQKIVAVSAASDGTTGYAFAGTARGLFSSNVDPEGGDTSASLSLVTATAGLNITRLATVLHGGTSYSAAFAEDTGEVVILTGLNNVVARYPRLSGLPDGTLSLSWWQPSDGKLYLVVSGTNGTVAIPQ